MKNICLLSDAELKTKLEVLVREERNLLCEILDHLKEVERRMLHLHWGYPSLFEYVKSLGYSESAAFRRISAMRLMKELPVIENEVASGNFNLSQLTAASEYFKKEKKSGNAIPAEQKLELLAELKGKSSRECEMIIVSKNPDLIVPQEEIRLLSENLTEIKMVVSQKLLQKIQRVKSIKSHVNPNSTHAELFELLLDETLKQYEKKINAVRKGEKQAQSLMDKRLLPAPEVKVRPGKPKVAFSEIRLTRSIPLAHRRFVFNRDQHRCTYQNSETGKICGSTFQLEIDHRMPFSIGGNHSTKNLRLLCRAHNQMREKKKAS